MTRPSPLMTTAEAMDYVRIGSRQSFWRWRKAKGLTPRETVGGHRYHVQDLDNAIARAAVPVRVGSAEAVRRTIRRRRLAARAGRGAA